MLQLTSWAKYAATIKKIKINFQIVIKQLQNVFW